MPRRTPLALSNHPGLTTEDLDEAREVTGRMWHDHRSDVVGRDHYRLEMNHAVAGTMGLTAVACTARVHVTVAGPADHVWVYVPLDGGIDLTTDGRAGFASPSRPLLQWFGEEVTFKASPMRCLVLAIPRTIVSFAAQSLSLGPAFRSTPLTDGPGQALVRTMVRLYDAVNAMPRESLGGDAAGSLPPAVTRLENDLLDRLAAVAEGRMPTRSSGESRELANVADAKMWLEANAHRPIRVADVAAHLGVPARAVERAFVRAGCTAQTFLRSVRLERAHDLLARGGEATSVAAAARAAGFTHLGRFASDFEQRFGVLPSAVRCG